MPGILLHHSPGLQFRFLLNPGAKLRNQERWAVGHGAAVTALSLTHHQPGSVVIGFFNCSSYRSAVISEVAWWTYRVQSSLIIPNLSKHLRCKSQATLQGEYAPLLAAECSFPALSPFAPQALRHVPDFCHMSLREVVLQVHASTLYLVDVSIVRNELRPILEAGPRCLPVATPALHQPPMQPGLLIAPVQGS